MAQRASPSAPGERRRPPKLLFTVLNPLFKGILRSPLHGLLSKRLLVMTFTGRKTGKRYSTPLAYVQAGDTLLFGTQAPWWKNLRGGKPVSVRLRGSERTGVAEVVNDEAGMAECYRTLVASAPQYGRAIGVTLDANGEPDPAGVARARQRGHVVIRVTLDAERGA